MEHNFYDAKRCIKNRDSFQVINAAVSRCKGNDCLMMLLANVIQLRLHPFDDYLAMFLKLGIDLNYTQFKNRMNILMLACQKSTLQIVELLLDTQSFNPYEKDNQGRNVIHYSIQQTNEAEAIDIILCLFRRYPLLKEMGKSRQGNYLSQSIDSHKPKIIKLLARECNFEQFLSIGRQIFLPFHEAVKQHGCHKDHKITASILREIALAGCRADLLNKQGQNYIAFALRQRYISSNEMLSIVQEIKGEILYQNNQQATSEGKQEAEYEISIKQPLEDHQQSDQSEEMQQPDHQLISQQMYEMALDIHDSHQRTWLMIEPFYRDLEKLAGQFYGTLEIIGSFASNLWIPSCDVDLLMVIPEQDEELFNEIAEAMLSKIKRMNYHSRIKLLWTYKLPLIKIILSRQYDELEIELFLSAKNNIASRYVSYIQELINYYPEIQIIYYVLRRLLSERHLHDHKNGGIKAYALFLMIYTMRSHYHYPFISQFVQHFAYYYGLAYDYSARIDSQGEVEFKINIIDPLNRDNNMGGKNTDIVALREILQKIYYAINLQISGKRLPFIVGVIQEI